MALEDDAIILIYFVRVCDFYGLCKIMAFIVYVKLWQTCTSPLETILLILISKFTCIPADTKIGQNLLGCLVANRLNSSSRKKTILDYTNHWIPEITPLRKINPRLYDSLEICGGGGSCKSNALNTVCSTTSYIVLCCVYML